MPRRPAILVYRPSYVWLPVKATDWVGPVSQVVSLNNIPFSKSRRPRGIKEWLSNAASVASSLFVPTIGQAVLQAWTDRQLAITMETVNGLVNLTRDVLRRHNQMLNLNFQAIQKLQAEIDELGLEIDGLWRVLQQTCDTRWLTVKLCVTPVRANVTGSISRVSDWLKRSYFPEFVNLSQQVESSLDTIGGIKLKPVKVDLSGLGEVLQKLLHSVSSWFSWPNLTNWILIAVGLLVGLVVVKCLLERLFQAQQQLRVTTMMAMTPTSVTPDSDRFINHTPSWSPQVGRFGAKFVANRMAVSRV